MKNHLLPFLALLTLPLGLAAQNRTPSKEKTTEWVDSVFKSLSPEERIAQLMVVRLSTYDAKNKTAIFFEDRVDSLVRQYNIGGIGYYRHVGRDRRATSYETHGRIKNQSSKSSN